MKKRRIIAMCSLFLVFTLGGCQRALFPDNEKSLTQFDSYDTMRHGQIITEKPDEYGLPEPAIRSQLSRHRR